MTRFKKIFSFFLLSLLLISEKSFADVVKKIQIEGNNRISQETIMVFGDISIGKDYSVSDVNILIKKLYSTSFFTNISASIENNTLKIIVKENPIIKSLIFDGEKAKKYMEKITDLLSLRENGPFVENNVKRDINLIKEFYRSLGVYFVKIDFRQVKKLGEALTEVGLISRS